MKKYTIASIILLIAGFILAGVTFSQMPARMAIHWDANGIANGYSGRFIGSFFVPIFTLGIWLLLIFLPKLDPLKKNLKHFYDIYSLFTAVVIAYMLIIQAATVAFNFGVKFDFIKLMIPLMAVLIFFAGHLTEKSKRNFFIGIKTPWTLSSDKVWDASNQLGGRLFKYSSVIILLTMLIPNPYAIWVMLVVLLVASMIPVVYSYLIYPKNKGK